MFFIFSIADSNCNDREINDFINFLIKSHKNHIFNYIASIIYLKSSDEISYCLNGVFIAAAQNYNKLKNFNDCLSWLLNVARNITITENRKYITRTKHHVYIDSLECERIIIDITDISSNPEEIVINEMISEQYEEEDKAGEILRSLTPEERELRQLKFVEKLKDATIAEKLNMPVNTIKTKLRRLKIKIKNMVYSENCK